MVVYRDAAAYDLHLLQICLMMSESPGSEMDRHETL